MNMKITKTTVSTRAGAACAAEPFLVRPMTPASKIQAIASSTAAAHRALMPTGDLYRPVSTMIRARIGKAVMHIAEPEEQRERQDRRRVHRPLLEVPAGVDRRQRPAQQHPQGERRGDPAERDHQGPPPLLPHQPGVEFQADQEHEEHEPEVGDLLERDLVREQPGRDRRRDPAEDRRAEQHPGHHLADHRRLPDPPGQGPQGRAATMMMTRSASRKRRISAAFIGGPLGLRWSGDVPRRRPRRRRNLAARNIVLNPHGCGLKPIMCAARRGSKKTPKTKRGGSSVRPRRTRAPDPRPVAPWPLSPVPLITAPSVRPAAPRNEIPSRRESLY